MFIGGAKGFHIVVVEDQELGVVEVRGQGFGGREIEFVGGEHADDVLFGAGGVFRDPDDFGTAYGDGVFEAGLAHAGGLDFAAEVDGAGGVEAGADADAIFTGGEGDLMGADGLAFGGEVDGGLGGFGGEDGEVDGETFAGEDGTGDADGLGLELGLGASGEGDGVDGDA